MLGAALVLLGFFVTHAVLWSGEARIYSLCFLGLEILLILLLRQATRVPNHSEDWGNAALWLTLTIVATVATVHHLADLEPQYLTTMNLLLLCAGVLALEWLWLGLAALTIVSHLVLVQMSNPLPNDPISLTQTVFSMLLVAAGCLAVRRRGLWRQHKLVVAEREDNDLLRDAVRQAESLGEELDERVERRTSELVAANRGVEQTRTQKLVLSKQIERLRRRDHLGQLASSVAHDLGNRLTLINLNLDQLRESAPGPALEEVRRQLGDVAQLTRQMLLFSRRQPLEKARLSLEELLDSSRVLLAGVVGDQIELSVRIRCPGAHVLADRAQLQQAILHLALRAREAMHGRGSLRIRADRVDNRVVLSLSDSGPRMSRAEAEALFEPFASPEDGLGLAVVAGIVSQHGGSVWAQSSGGTGGTTILVALPLEPG